VPLYDETGRLIAYQIQGQRVARENGETEEVFDKRVYAMRIAQYTALFRE
jgi:hypothetical protein